MSLVLTLTTPAAATYDLALAANARFGVLWGSLPNLEQRVEQELTKFEAGELKLACRNDDGWWDTLLAGADHLARYPDTFVVEVKRDGAVRWEGDIDLLSVSFDRAAAKVEFTVTGKLKRLERYSAETVRRPFPTRCDFGFGTGSANLWTDTDKAWETDALVNHVLICGTTVYTITANTATTLTVSGTPASGNYTIRPSAWTSYVGSLPRKLTSLGPSVAALGLQEKDKLRIVFVNGDPPRLAWSKHGFSWANPFSSSELIVEVKHVGAKSFPSLTDHEIGVDQDLTVDIALGDGCWLDTPYYRDKTTSELAALLFEAAGLSASDYEVDVPALADSVVEYADFDGKNVAEALTELARLVGCTLTATPTKYLFQRRDVLSATAGTGGAIDLIVGKWSEQAIADESFDAVRVEGADGSVLTRGRVSFLSRVARITSDWISTYAWMKQVADRAWALFGGSRRSADVSVLDGWGKNYCLDPSFEGSAAVNAALCPWKVNVAAGAGETIEKSAVRAGHLRQSLHLVADGTSGLGVVQLLMGTGTVTASSSSGLLLTTTQDIGNCTRVRFTTTGTLPTGLSLATDYWTIRVSGTTFRVATTLALAAAGTAIAYTDAGTGTHTVTARLHGLAASETVLLSARALVTSRTAGTLNLDLYGKDSSGTVVLDSSGTYWNKAARGGLWWERSESVTIPASCAWLWARVFWSGAGVKGEAYVDAVRVESSTVKVAPALLQEVSLAGESYATWAVREPLRSSVLPSVVELRLLGMSLAAPSATYDVVSDDATPPPPEVTACSAGTYDGGENTSTYRLEVTWPYPDQPVAALLFTVWRTGFERPDTGATFDVPPSRKTGSTTIFTHELVVSGNVNANQRIVDYMILYVNGKVSSPSAPYALPDAT